MSWPAKILTISTIVIVGTILGSHGHAGALSREFSADSHITLRVHSEGFGNVLESIDIRTVDGISTLESVRRKKAHSAKLRVKECAALWNYLFDRGVENMTDAFMANPTPDQAMITLSLRVGATTHKWTSYGVDFLPDPRYRDIVRYILDLESAYERTKR